MTTDMTHDDVHPETRRSYGGEFHPWTWREDDRHGEHFRRCSWCGSIHPIDLAAEPEWRPEWADQKYGWPHKFYVRGIKNRDPERLYRLGSCSHFHDGDRERGFTPTEELTPEQLEICARDRWEPQPGGGVMFGTRPEHFGKFYTVHLGDPDIPPDVIDNLHRRSGLQFRFAGGRTYWGPYGMNLFPPPPANPSI